MFLLLLYYLQPKNEDDNILKIMHVNSSEVSTYAYVISLLCHHVSLRYALSPIFQMNHNNSS